MDGPVVGQEELFQSNDGFGVQSRHGEAFDLGQGQYVVEVVDALEKVDGHLVFFEEFELVVHCVNVWDKVKN